MTRAEFRQAGGLPSIESAIKRDMLKLELAETRRDRLTTRIRQIEDELDHLRREHQRVATGSTDVLDAPAKLVRHGNLNTWRVECPFCGHHHRHGASETGAPPLGTRLSHCAQPFHSHVYELVPVEAGER